MQEDAATPSKQSKSDDQRIKYNTTQGLHSVAELYHKLIAAIQYTGYVIRDTSFNRLHLSPGCSPAEHLTFMHMDGGMS
eukprot:5400829-Ditylum_brightwellii.AAC.1